MNFEHLEEKLTSIVAKPDEDEFIYDLLSAYDQPRASISRLRRGTANLSKSTGEILWKRKLYFKVERERDLHVLIDECQKSPVASKHRPRFVIVTDMKTLLAMDMANADSLDIPIKDLPKHYDFFLPWAGLEKAQISSENPADIKAAVKMGRLYDLILADNPVHTTEQRHSLNVFLSRLLFCYFAEDTGIFAPNQFTNGVASHTESDGADLQAYLEKVFTVLSTQQRKGLPQYLQDFPYVNGGLFSEEHPVPMFTRKSRQIIIECGSLDWKAINPDIFGSMIQAVVHDDDRGKIGMHYTSVVNIMKVIEPLFLNDLREQLDAAGKDKKKLQQFLDRLYHLRLFDPACGSGNFLIIAYKELCKLEIEAFKMLHSKQTTFKYESKVRLSQFYGIELDDFAHETARLSLWLTAHQMNLAFREVFGDAKPTLPLQDGGNIVSGNATQLKWTDVCPPSSQNEILIFGNPPYFGARNQSREQKADLALVFDNHEDHKDSDYVSCWFLKGAQYVRNRRASIAFVATNSVCQGEQVGYLWPRILTDLEIGFAHQAFKWTNNARNNAGVTCVIVGLRNPAQQPKVIFQQRATRIVKNISPYLIEGNNSVVRLRKVPLSPRPKVVMGNMARDGGNLILSDDEASYLRKTEPGSAKFLKRFSGGDEFLYSKKRWCLWITDETLGLAQTITPIRNRIDLVRQFRLASTARTTQQYGAIPHKFAQRNYVPGDCIIIPAQSSEQREYIPMGYLSNDIVISNLAYVVYNSSLWLYAIVSSRMHMAWVRIVGGALETRPRYSSELCYNTFPFPKLSDDQKNALKRVALRVLDVREQHSERTLAELYDSQEMPTALRRAHHELDEAVERCYRKAPFKDDEERFAYLFKEYEKLVENDGKHEENS
jgi:hypothetical protein